MFYDIGSVSNRNIQLLYKYRILREPSDYLTAICRASEPEMSNELKWTLSDREIDSQDVIYQAILPGITPKDNHIPFLEFETSDELEWKWICDLIDVEVTQTAVILYSTTNYLQSLPIRVYWCMSLRHIESMLEEILEQLEKLAGDYAKLEESIKAFKDTGAYLRRPEGLVPNLVKIQRTAEETTLVDSLYRVMTAESNRLFVNYSQPALNKMERIFNETVEFRFLDTDHYVLDSLVAPVVLISGNGDLVVKNIQGQVLITKWRGTITVIDCPEVHISATTASDVCQLEKLQITKNSTVYLENQIHQISELVLMSNSICRHWRANVRRLSYVGPGCTYWCCSKVSVPGRIQLTEYLPDSNTVFDFNLSDIVGEFLSDFDNIMIIGQKNITTRLGNHDAEPMPSMYVPYWQAEYNRIVSEGGSL